MSTLRLYNTMSQQVEEFKPIEARHVRMYTCGPTVHDYAHIGNFRTFLFEDLLRRVLIQNGYQVTQVMNLTDVEDRIIKKAADKHVPIDAFTEPYIEAFFEDLDTLRIQRAEQYPRATRHVPEMVSLIQVLKEKGHTYETEGSTYFRIATFPPYGALSHLDVKGLKAGARVDVDDYGKDDPRDFVLWKAHKPGEASWNTALGEGRPGWHIECSAMSMKYLGESFDIHTGGVDNIFPHHENEIAQSEAATGKRFVRYWLHAQHLQDAVGEKMSKRLKNFSTLRDLLTEGYQPRVIRYALMAGAHYRSPLAFSDELLRAADSAVKRLNEFAIRLTQSSPAPLVAEGRGRSPSPLVGEGRGGGAAFDTYRQRWDDALNDDLNLPTAVGVLFEFVRDVNTRIESGKLTPQEREAALDFLHHANRILDVVEFPQAPDADVQRLIDERQAARDRKDFKRADEIRQELLDMGIQLDDTKDGTRWKRLQ